MWVCSASQSCLTLYNPMDCSPPGFSAQGIFQSRRLEWVAISSSRRSSRPRDRTHVSWISRRILYQSHQGSLCPILQMRKWKPREVEPKFTLNVKPGFEAASAGSLFSPYSSGSLPGSWWRGGWWDLKLDWSLVSYKLPCPRRLPGRGKFEETS